MKSIVKTFLAQENAKLFLTELSYSTKSTILVRGLVGSSRSLLASASLKEHGGTNIFVLDSKDEAAYFYDDLCNLGLADRVLFFPSSYKRSIQFEQQDPSGIIQRTATLSALKEQNSKPKAGFLAVVSYPEALAEKVVSEDTLKNSTLAISVGDKLSIDFVREAMSEYGFDRADFVYEPGQYAVRGSIVDIFSYSANKPYRIDFFGNEVDTIRTFDLSTQLSIEKLERIEVVSNLNQGEQACSFFDFINSAALLWFDNFSYFCETIGKTFDSVEGKPSQQLLTTKADVASTINKFSTVLFSPIKKTSYTKTVEFSTSPQPSFNKKFELLAENIRENKAKGYSTLILADNPQQHDRLNQIFESLLEDKVAFEAAQLSLHEGFIDHSTKTCYYTDHQIFQRHHRFKLRGDYEKSETITIQELNSLHVGDYVVHIDHGVGMFGGLVKTVENGKVQESIKLIYKDSDVLFVSIQGLHRIARYKSGDGTPPKVYKLGTGAWQKLKQTTKKKVKDIARELITLYAQRKVTTGFAYAPDSYLQHELEASFIYEDTPDQEKATKALKEDMESAHPMDRLICGDVGFGKTEIAIRAAFKAVCDGKQVAVLVPTTILSLQHHRSFSDRLREFPVRVEFISRLKTAKQAKQILKDVEDGKVDILIGTHRILSKDVVFKDLGLLIVDEEQKFGVGAKEKLRQLKMNVDTLTLTATPIPRTLQFSLLGARDLSIISTPPPNRLPIATELHTFNEEIIKEALSYEIARGGQAFFIHNRIQDIKDIEGLIHRLCPGVKTAIGHGQMDPEQLEGVMLDFMNGDFDVLVTTTIVESGLDIPNANTIIVNQAQNFGLSDLHQLRGRVGRSNKRAFCYLLAPPVVALSDDARRRLKAIEEFSDLGSGFNIAMQDLDIRGAGNLLGGEQSGYIADMGFETYQRILSEALLELKEEGLIDTSTPSKDKPVQPAHIAGAQDSFISDCYIEADFEALFPDEYVGNTAEKIRLYKELDSMDTEASLQRFKEKLIDRFGTPPPAAEELFNIVRLRQRAIKLGFERIVMKNGIMVASFVTNQQSAYYRTQLFSSILQYIQSHPKHFKIKEDRNKLSLTINNIKSVAYAIAALDNIASSTT